MGKRHCKVLASIIGMAAIILSANSEFVFSHSIPEFECPPGEDVNLLNERFLLLNPVHIATGKFKDNDCKNTTPSGVYITGDVVVKGISAHLQGTYQINDRGVYWETFTHPSRGADDTSCSVYSWLYFSNDNDQSSGGSCTYNIHSCSFKGGGSHCPSHSKITLKLLNPYNNATR